MFFVLSQRRKAAKMQKKHALGLQNAARSLGVLATWREAFTFLPPNPYPSAAFLT